MTKCAQRPPASLVIIQTMDPVILESLRTRTSVIRDGWERLLRGERVSNPLANPDALIHYIPTTLKNVFGALATWRRRVVPAVPALALQRRVCACGYNPYLAYFVAGEQVLLETLVLVQAEAKAVTDCVAEATVLQSVVRSIAAQEIESFCGVCTHQGKVDGCTRGVPADER